MKKNTKLNLCIHCSNPLMGDSSEICDACKEANTKTAEEKEHQDTLRAHVDPLADAMAAKEE